MGKIVSWALAAGLALICGVPATADPLAKDVFGAARGPTAGPAQAIGFYSKGCASGLVAMPESGPTWQVMRLSRNRFYGTPDLVGLLQGLSQVAAQVGWRGLYFGDMSQPRGGPMVTGHASHQLGLDADIWMLPPPSLQLSQGEREKISSQSVVAGNGTQPSALWSGAHMAIIRAAARDPRVQRIFVDPVAKWSMCQSERGDRSYLRKIQVLNGHDYHFHVRLRCPAGSPGCTGQAEVPPGDHCDAAAQAIQERINPPKPAPGPQPATRHPRSYRLSELPSVCRNVAAAR
ncbi:penicillin-insensitive murein endopeptidase [Paracoccus pacificus]|uniref:Penicillin-insensitive murein endopeptidase n=1 Tax=Paracoccus pacificus TaxID=1463598 RepID=A0ABW4RBT1_9RHOB